MIIDASVVVDAAGDVRERGDAARAALASCPEQEVLSAPGHLAIEVLSGLRACANRPTHPLRPEEVADALVDAEALGITIETTPWSDVRRAWELSLASLRYTDGLYVAAAERLGTTLLTVDARIARSGAKVRCEVVTVGT